MCQKLSLIAPILLSDRRKVRPQSNYGVKPQVRWMYLASWSRLRRHFQALHQRCPERQVLVRYLQDQTYQKFLTLGALLPILVASPWKEVPEPSPCSGALMVLLVNVNTELITAKYASKRTRPYRSRSALDACSESKSLVFQSILEKRLSF